MTSEVAIANGGAIALAADSAVTIGGKKIYNSAIKLFSLSKYHPIGIMIYGNASLLDVPWETLIKICRAEIGERKFDQLEAYGDFFIKFIKKHTEYFPDSSQKAWIKSNAKKFFELIRNEFFKDLEHCFQNGETLSSEQIIEKLDQIIIRRHNEVSSRDRVIDIDDGFEKAVKKKYRPLFKEVVKVVFENVNISRSMNSKLIDIATYLQTRAIYPNGTSGIVIAGFGDKEIFPSILTYEIEGVLDGRLKYRKLDGKSYKIKSGSDCSIVAFAQEDMVAAFMQGVNPSITNLIDQYLNQIFSRLPELLDDADLAGSAKSADYIRSEFGRNSHQLKDDFIGILETHIREQHISPVVNMVTALPKDELAAMAEALVNLTAFKRRMTESLETVGGPVDVAIISKGDGLVWVKRKLYFPKELNQVFFENYFRSMENEK